eukprot:12617-Chlamydomonas_euryale.AAC.1
MQLCAAVNRPCVAVNGDLSRCGTYCKWITIACRGRGKVSCGRCRVAQLKLRQGHGNITDFVGMYSSAFRSCHEQNSGVRTTSRDFLNLIGHTKLIPWPKIQRAAAERALDRQAWWEAI